MCSLGRGGRARSARLTKEGTKAGTTTGTRVLFEFSRYLSRASHRRGLMNGCDGDEGRMTTMTDAKRNVVFM